MSRTTPPSHKIIVTIKEHHLTPELVEALGTEAQALDCTSSDLIIQLLKCLGADGIRATVGEHLRSGGEAMLSRRTKQQRGWGLFARREGE